MSNRLIIRSLLLLVAFFVVAFTQNCSAPMSKVETVVDEPETPGYDLDSVLASRKLRAIVANSSTSYFIYKGQPMGYEYELLKILADSLGLELEIKVADDLDRLIEMLNNGEGDIIAAHLTVTSQRAKDVSFTDYHVTTRQMLVQRKPADYRRMHSSQIEKELIRNQIDLIGQEVYVRKNSSYYGRLNNLAEEIGGKIDIKTVKGEVETEELIAMVADGKISHTVADEHLAMQNARYYGNLDVKTPISFPQKIAWAVNQKSPKLLKRINEWLANMKKHPAFHHIKNKYFKPTNAQLARFESDFNSESGGKISPYDDLLKQYSESLGWDWRLLSSLVFQESRFNNNLESWAGAKGLMQLMPATARRFGVNVDTVFTPQQSVAAGTEYLKWLDRFWVKHVADSMERVKFILASYNAGHGHVLDAWRLAKKYEKNAAKWEGNTEDFLLNMSLKKYYKDDVVENGYCRCKQPVKYVREILSRYEQYKAMIPLTPEKKEVVLGMLLTD